MPLVSIDLLCWLNWIRLLIEVTPTNLFRPRTAAELYPSLRPISSCLQPPVWIKPARLTLNQTRRIKSVFFILLKPTQSAAASLLKTTMILTGHQRWEHDETRMAASCHSSFEKKNAANDSLVTTGYITFILCNIICMYFIIIGKIVPFSCYVCACEREIQEVR